MNVEPSKRCVTCGATLHGEYCHVCGERSLGSNPPSLVRFVTDLLSEVFDTDGRIVKTMRTLVLRPGRLTVEYMAGRRGPYLSPTAVFIVMNVLFFFIQPLVNINTFIATLEGQSNWYPYSPWVTELVNEKLSATGISRETYEANFDAASENYARTLIFLQVPLLAVGLALVHIVKRRFFVEHLVFATHFYTAMLLMNIVAGLGLWAYFRLGLGNEFNLELTFTLLIWLYLFLATREAYADGWIGSGIKAFLLMTVVLAVINVYRFLLFLVTFWTV